MMIAAVNHPPDHFSSAETSWCARCNDYLAQRDGGLCPVCMDDDRCRSILQKKERVTAWTAREIVKARDQQ